MKAFTDRLYQALENHLYEISIKTDDEVGKLKQTIFSCKKALAILKRFISDYFFECSEDEVFFFKCIKPRFYSKLIYYIFVYKYILKQPSSCKEVKDQYIS